MSTMNVELTSEDEDTVERHTKREKNDQFQEEPNYIRKDTEASGYLNYYVQSNSRPSSELSLKSVSNNNEDDGNRAKRKQFQIEIEPKVGSRKWKQDKIRIWEGFVIFSQFEAFSYEQKKYNGWSEFDAISCWNPYSANMKQVATYMHILECKRKFSSEEKDFCVNQILQYLPHLKAEEMHKLEIESNPDVVEIIFNAINKDQPTVVNTEQITGTNTSKRYKSGKNTKNTIEYNGAIWKDFVGYCADYLQEDPFLTQPQNVKEFIKQVFDGEASSKFQTSPSLENYPSFYCSNAVNICKHLGFYLKFEYESGVLVASDPIETLLSLFHCLDQKLIHPTGNFSKDDLGLMKRLIPKYWYVKHESRSISSDFWKQKLVSDILNDVQNKVLTDGEAAWELGVTPDMLACAVTRMKPANQNLSLTIKEYVEQGFGSEEAFWGETSTEMMLEDIRNRVLDFDSAAFQLGTSSAQVREKVGKIKTAFQLHEEKNRIREEKKKEMRANATPKLTPLQFKIQLGEQNEDNLSEYEKMRLTNMRERLSFLNTLEIEKDKKALNAITPTKPSYSTYSSYVFIEPREKSSRIKILAEKKDKIRPESSPYTSDKKRKLRNETSVDAEMDRLSPLWVAKRTPKSTTYLMTDPIAQVSWEIVAKKSETLSVEELSSMIPVPKLTMAATDLIAKDSNYFKSKKFIQRLESEVNLSGKETKIRKTVDISKWIHAGGGKASKDEIVSLAISEELIAFGDAGGGLGVWMGEKSLLLRPHHMPVCRTAFLGTGAGTRIATASHDGTVRIYDVSSQAFELGFSWNKFYKHQQGVVWMEPVDQTTLLINCEEGDVLNVDRRDGKVAKILCLPKSRRNCRAQMLVTKNICGASTGIYSTPALVGSNIAIHPIDRNLISLCDDETVVVYDRRNCRKPIFTIGTVNKLERTPWNSILNHHCGSAWSPSGDHFVTYQRGPKQILQGTVNLYSHYQLMRGDDPKPIGPTNSKYEPVFSPGQGIVWSPWQDDVYYLVANTKPIWTNKHSYSVLAGERVGSGDVVGELYLPTRPPSMVGCHPTRPQVVMANLNEIGDVVIYKEEQVCDNLN